MKSKRDIEREWRRIERREWMENLGWPLIFLCAVGSLMIVGMQYFPQIFGPICAFLAAIGMPLMMWLNKK